MTPQYRMQIDARAKQLHAEAVKKNPDEFRDANDPGWSALAYRQLLKEGVVPEIAPR